jgi:hypothetical protein
MAATHHHLPFTTLAVALASLAIAAALAGAAVAAGSPGSRPTAVQIVRISTHSFDWGAAGIGAAAGVGISMLAVGAVLLIKGNRRDRAALRRLAVKEQR